MWTKEEGRKNWHWCLKRSLRLGCCQKKKKTSHEEPCMTEKIRIRRQHVTNARICSWLKLNLFKFIYIQCCHVQSIYRKTTCCSKPNLETASIVCFQSRNILSFIHFFGTDIWKTENSGLCAKLSVIFPATMNKIRKESEHESGFNSDIKLQNTSQHQPGFQLDLGERTLFAKLLVGFIQSTCSRTRLKSSPWNDWSTECDVSLQNLSVSDEVFLLLLSLCGLLNVGKNAASAFSQTGLKYKPSALFVVIFVQGFYVLPSSGLWLCRWERGN